MKEEVGEDGFKINRVDEKIRAKPHCSVSIVFAEKAEEDVLSSSMGMLEKQYVDKSIMR